MLNIDPDASASHGAVQIYNDTGKKTILLYSSVEGGLVVVKNGVGQETLRLDGLAGMMFVGGANQGGIVMLRDGAGQNTMILDGVTGDINLLNADCAEDFDISELDEVEPGTVMILDHEGKLQQGREAYDKKVAGVISGAGDYKPGIVLDKKQSKHHRLPVALMGKVYCKVDAQYSRIEVGDLLTTSPTAGHTMKATDPLKSLGAIIGKALRPLQEGQGLIPVLIALQ